jgi:hypothetical protein
MITVISLADKSQHHLPPIHFRRSLILQRLESELNAVRVQEESGKLAGKKEPIETRMKAHEDHLIPTFILGKYNANANVQSVYAATHSPLLVSSARAAVVEEMVAVEADAIEPSPRRKLSGAQALDEELNPPRDEADPEDASAEPSAVALPPLKPRSLSVSLPGSPMLSPRSLLSSQSAAGMPPLLLSISQSAPNSPVSTTRQLVPVAARPQSMPPVLVCQKKLELVQLAGDDDGALEMVSKWCHLQDHRRLISLIHSPPSPTDTQRPHHRCVCVCCAPRAQVPELPFACFLQGPPIAKKYSRNSVMSMLSALEEAGEKLKQESRKAHEVSKLASIAVSLVHS